ncbi:MAG TPA: fibronectin type III domain-containing protein [Terriglobia bacterium]|jgi:hypothetical protein
MSNSTTKLARVAMIFNRLTPDQLVSAGTAAVNGMDGNPKLTAPPIAIADLKGGLQSLSTSVAAAQDGGKTAIAERNKQFRAFVKMLKKEAVYVEDVSGTDPTVITAAGFQVMAGPTPAPPLIKSVVEKLVQDGPGQQKVFVEPQAGTRMLEIQSGEQGPNNTPPASWTTIQAPSARPAPVVSGLTPGKVYVFQARAFGKSGWSEWSDPVIKMTT